MEPTWRRYEGDGNDATRTPINKTWKSTGVSRKSSTYTLRKWIFPPFTGEQFANPKCSILSISLDWCKGKLRTGNHCFTISYEGFRKCCQKAILGIFAASWFETTNTEFSHMAPWWKHVPLVQVDDWNYQGELISNWRFRGIPQVEYQGHI